MKKVTFLSVITFIFFAFISGVSANADTTSDSKDYEIGEKVSNKELDEIKASIKNGDIMGLEKSDNQLTSTKKWSFFGMDRNPTYNVEGDLSGTLTATLGFFNHTTRWNINASGYRVSESRARGTIMGYGIAGSDGVIGKIVDTGVSSGWRSGTRANYTGSKAFTGAVLYARFQAYADFKYPGGVLTVVDSVRQDR